MYINPKHAWWLKEHGGFDEWCSHVYDIKGNIKYCHGSGGTNRTHSKDYCSAPYHGDMKLWLKSKGYYYLSIEPQGEKWRWLLYNLKTGKIDAMNLSGTGYWEAEKDGVERAMELITGINLSPHNPTFTPSSSHLVSKQMQLKFEIARVEQVVENIRRELEVIRKYFEQNLEEIDKEKLRVVLEDMITGEEFLRASRDILDDADKLC